MRADLKKKRSPLSSSRRNVTKLSQKRGKERGGALVGKIKKKGRVFISSRKKIRGVWERKGRVSFKEREKQQRKDEGKGKKEKREGPTSQRRNQHSRGGKRKGESFS